MRNTFSTQTLRKCAKPVMFDLGPDDLEWLCGSEAAGILQDLAGQCVTATLITRLRKTLTAKRASAIAVQVELRDRARAKFQRADRMLFTRRAFEQATDEWVARYKAERFRAIDSERLCFDFCCGLGGDLIGLSGSVCGLIGADRDPVLACFARHNTAVYDAAVDIRCEELKGSAAAGAAAWHADPDRRAHGRRTSQPDTHEPSLSVIEAWLRDAPNGALKLAPAARLEPAWEEASELEWISRGGECRQLVAWRGRMAAHTGRRAATRVQAFGDFHTVSSFSAAPQPPPEGISPISSHVYDLDPALLAAGLQWAFAESHGLAPFTRHAAYLTGECLVDSPLLQAFRVDETFTLDRRKLGAWLQEKHYGRLEIKCRGVDLSPERLRVELQPRGDLSATLIVAPAPPDWPGGADRPCVIVCHRAPLPSDTTEGG